MAVMAAPRRRLIAGVVVGVVVLGAVFLVARGRGDDGPSHRARGTANLFVDPSGGSCTRHATGAGYADGAACRSFDAANDACRDGDLVLVKGGDYGDQPITGSNNRTRMCTIEAAPGENVRFRTLTTDGDWLTLRHMDSHTGETTHLGIGGCVWCDQKGGSHLVLDDVNLFGKWAAGEITGARDVTWRRSELGTKDNRDPRLCNQDDLPFRIAGSRGVVIDHNTFHPFFGEEGCYHLETFRLWDSSDGLTFSDNHFDDGRGDTSFTISSSRGGCPPERCPANKNIRLVGNYFGDKCCGYEAPDFSTGEACVGIVLAYNFFKDQTGGFQSNCTSESRDVYVGNLGFSQGGCPLDGTVTGNLWIGDTPGDCPGNRWLPGTQDDWAAYRLAPDGRHLTADSPAIDAGESELCEKYTHRVDSDGDRRSGTCDAGPDEYDAGT